MISPNPKTSERLSISNGRLLRFDDTGFAFHYKGYHRDSDSRRQVMALTTDDFIRRFLVEVLPRGFYRIRHY